MNSSIIVMSVFTRTYTRNRAGYCGPAVIYNAMLFKNKTPHPLEKLTEMCNTEKHDCIGTYSFDMQRVIHGEFESNTMTSDKVEILAALNRKKGVILGYKDDRFQIIRNHYALFFKENHQIFSINESKDSPIVSYISKDLFEYFLKIHYQHTRTHSYITHPQAWFI